GRVRLVAGQTVTVTALVAGAPFPAVDWNAGTGFPGTQGATYTITPYLPGHTVVVNATAMADRTIGSEVIVDVVPPDCMKLWPSLRPATLQNSIVFPDYLHIPVAVR